MAQPAPQMIGGIVKQVMSGDSIIVRGPPRNGPPVEKQISLSNVTAPKMARRANTNIDGSTETRDEPYAWESREFLRKLLIGKEVWFTVEYNVPGTGRAYGCVFIKKGEDLKNVVEMMVAEGLVELRREGMKASETQTALIALEDIAKDQGKGKWALDNENHIRNIKWTHENPRLLVDQKQSKAVDAIIEQVRDGSTVRALLLPNFDYVTVMLSGIKCPSNRRDGDREVAEPFADQARFFTESRLLQRDVQIRLEGVSNQNLLGTVVHPAGNISEFLLREGFARCVDWSMGVVSSGHEKYREAEKAAKEAQLRIWKGFVASASKLGNISEREFTAKVMEVVNADAVVVRRDDGKDTKLFLSSLRPPRLQPSGEPAENGAPPTREAKRGRPLYDIPYMFEAREFLRRKLIDQKVNVTIDYIKPANEGYPERTCATVKFGEVNVAEALISKGFATTLRHKHDDELRSSCYDALLSAENRATKNSKGLWSKKEPPIHRIADVSGDSAKARQFLPSLQRAGRITALVEFVASGSRMRLYMPKQTCLVTFLLGGINCPRVRAVNNQGTVINEGDENGSRAQHLSKSLAMQREIEIAVDSMDKGGNFIGWMFVNGKNLSVMLVEAGLSSVHGTAERSPYYQELINAETKAKSAKLGIWATYVEEPKEIQITEEVERKTNYKKVIVTDVIEGVHFWAQTIDNASSFETMMNQMRADLVANPPLPGSCTPKKGDMCAGQFVDDLWYRVKVEKVEGNNSVHVLYVDFGNREVISVTKMAPLPPNFHTFPVQANEYCLACVSAPKDADNCEELTNAFQEAAYGKEFLLNVEYRFQGQDSVTLVDPETKEDMAKRLLSNGYGLAEKRKEKRLQSLVNTYMSAQNEAKMKRLNLWQYGDFTEEDTPEFGFKQS